MSREKNKALGWTAAVYIAAVLIWFSIGDYDKHPALSAFAIFSGSVLFTYGALGLYRDLKLFGWRWIVKTWMDAFK